jgi:RNA recognition motif-containing protein
MAAPSADSPKLFVSRIPAYCSEKDVRAVFEKFGTIIEFKMVPGADQQNHRGS